MQVLRIKNPIIESYGPDTTYTLKQTMLTLNEQVRH
jgi:hypothetical protein